MNVNAKIQHSLDLEASEHSRDALWDIEKFRVTSDVNWMKWTEQVRIRALRSLHICLERRRKRSFDEQFVSGCLVERSESVQHFIAGGSQDGKVEADEFITWKKCKLNQGRKRGVWSGYFVVVFSCFELRRARKQDRT